MDLHLLGNDGKHLEALFNHQKRTDFDLTKNINL